MGWLDHSTNNIILDAVLTDYGRQKLSAASESFKIDSYSLGDDEIDYRLVKKYGRSVGKEKIEKNTPIFEAMTNQNYALKYKLIGRESNSDSLSLIYLPTMSYSPQVIALTQSAIFATITVVLNTTTSPNSSPLTEENFVVEVSDRFFTISSASAAVTQATTSQVSAADPNKITRYNVGIGSGIKNQITFQVRSRTGIDSTTMSIYGKKLSSGSSQRTVTSNIRVSSKKYGTTLDIPVTYTQ